MNLDTGVQRRVLDRDRSTTDEGPVFAEDRALRTSDGKLAVPDYSSGGTRAPRKTKASSQESYELLHHKLKLVMFS